MPANYCSDCSAAWPRDHPKCPWCEKTLIYKSQVAAMSKEDYDQRMVLVRARRGHAAPLPDGVQELIDREWARLEAIAKQSRLSVADLIDAAPRRTA